MHRGLFALACGAAAFAGSAALAVVPGKLETFQDWTVGCDNGLACQAVALMPEGQVEGSLSLVVMRAAAANAQPTIELSGFQAKTARYRVLIDGRTVHSGAMQAGAESVKISGANAMRLARAMARGKKLQLVDAAGTDLGGASLAGTSAAFRHADAQQGRAGSRGAIVAIGVRASRTRKADIPVITARKIMPSDMLPDASALVALSESSPCAAERFGSTEDTAYSLGTGAQGPQALVLLNCGAGAYNFSSGVYVGQRDAGGKWTFAPAKFDYGASGFSNESKIPILVNADWNPATQTLTSYAKGRGLGDCGSSESYVWDGTSFRLTGATVMGECRGSMDWIPVWRAEVRLVS